MSPSDWINIADDKKAITIVVPGGWTVETIAMNHEVDLQITCTGGVRGERTRVIVDAVGQDVNSPLIGLGGLGPDFMPEEL